MVGLYDVYIAGIKRLPLSGFFEETLVLPAGFEYELEPEATYGNLGDLVEIKQAGTTNLEYTGIIDRRNLTDNEDQTITIAGKDQISMILTQHNLDREIYLGSEPSAIFKCLLNLALEGLVDSYAIAQIFRDDFSGAIYYLPDYDPVTWHLKRGTGKIGGDYFEGYDPFTSLPAEYERNNWLIRYGVDAENKSDYCVYCRVTPACRGDGGTSKTDTRTGLILYSDAAFSKYYAALLYKSPDTTDLWLMLYQTWGGDAYDVMDWTNFTWEWGKEYLIRFRVLSQPPTKNTLYARVLAPTVGTALEYDDEGGGGGDDPKWAGWAGVMFGLTKGQFRDFFVRDYIEITASGTAAGLDPELVADGNIAYAWKPDAVPSWIKLNYGSLKSIGRIDVFTDITGSRPLKVETSPDDAAWTTRYNNAAHQGEHLVIPFTAANIRYVRVSQASGTIYGIKEIRCYPQQGTSTIVSTGTINDYGTPIEFRCDYENLLNSVLRLGKQLAWNVWGGPDNKINFTAERGSDKSAQVTFQRGVNMFGAERELDGLELDWKVKVLGLGEGISQKVSVKTDASVLANYPALAKSRTYTDKTFIDQDLMDTYAQTLLTMFSTPRDRVTGALDETYPAGTWRAGDTIKLINPVVGLNGNYRVLRVTKVLLGGMDLASIEAYPSSQLKLPEYRDLEDLFVDIVTRLKSLEGTPQS